MNVYEPRLITAQRTEEEWQAFRDQADADFESDTAEEMRRRAEELPIKEIPFRAEVQYDYVIDYGVRIPMRDGITLHAEVYRPDAEGAFPVVINRGPYDCRSTLDNTPAVARCLAKRGYIVVSQDVRGRFGSEGEPFLGNEAEDGIDTVNWAGTQPWSNGNVGMYGISYGAMTSLEAATGQSQYLKAIYPAMISYNSGPVSGIPALQTMGAWLLWAGYGKEGGNPLRIDLSHLPLVEIDENTGYGSELFKMLVTNTSLTRYTSEEIEQRLKKINIPTTMIAAWYDIFLDGEIADWNLLHQNNPEARLIIGPYHHNLCEMEEMEHPGIGQLRTEHAELDEYFFAMETLFDTHLKGQGVVEDAPIRLYVMGRNEWRNEDEWPLARTHYKKLYFHSTGYAASDLNDGVMGWEPPVSDQAADAYDYNPLYPVTWSSEKDIWAILMNMGDRNEVEARPDVLTYTTPVLEEDLEVTGPIAAKIYAASSAPDTDFFVTLVDVHPDGHTQYLTQGQIRARYRKGMDQMELITPNEVYEYDISIQSTSNVFLKGHQLRIEISSSDFDRFARNQNVADDEGVTADTQTALNSILHTAEFPSQIVLPVIPNEL